MMKYYEVEYQHIDNMNRTLVIKCNEEVLKMLLEIKHYIVCVGKEITHREYVESDE